MSGQQKPLANMANINQSVSTSLNPSLSASGTERKRKDVKSVLPTKEHIRVETTRSDDGSEVRTVHIDFKGLDTPTLTTRCYYRGINPSNPEAKTRIVFRDDMRIKVTASCTLPPQATATSLKHAALDARDAELQAQLAALLEDESEVEVSENENDYGTEVAASNTVGAPKFSVRIPEISAELAPTFPIWSEVVDKKETINGVVYSYSVEQFNPAGFKETKPRAESKSISARKQGQVALAKSITAVRHYKELANFNREQFQKNAEEFEQSRQEKRNGKRN